MNMVQPIHAASDVGRRPTDHPPVKSGRIGVLLMNLGTPEATDYWSMRRYLKEFLSDRRVIETSRLIWWPVLDLIILSKRPGPKGRDYASIWNKDLNEGPLKTITRSQTEQLAAHLKETAGDRVTVDWAMRYGNPPIRSAIENLLRQGCDRILLVPLYPQYAAATTATACDHAFRALMDMRWPPTIRVSPPYHDDPVYIDAVVSAMKRDVAALAFEPEVILVSFHGVPKSYLLKGDPYHCHCVKTWRLMRDAFGWPESGVKRMAIVAPGFSADCLETLEELNVENRHIFMEHGGEDFAYLPCLNDSEGGMRVIRHIVERELQGWI